MSKTIIKAHSDASNVSIGAKTLTTSSVVLKKELSDDLTIKSGFSMIHEDMIVGLNKTLIIESNANLSVFDELLINGTVDVSGDVIIRSQYDDTEVTNDINTLENPSLMSDSLATRLGHMTYVHDGSYSGGAGPSMTLSSGSLSSITSTFVPYETKEGWRIRMNINSTASGVSSGTTFDLQINGLVFPAPYPVTIWDALNVPPYNGSSAQTSTSTNIIRIYHASGTPIRVRLSADLPLSQKPTWAY